MTRIWDFTAVASDGSEVPLARYEGSVLLVVNTASKCGLTPQFAGLQELHDRFKDEGFSVLGFPCGQFAGQEFDDQERTLEFCQREYDVTFPMFARIDVNGRNTHPLYRWLKRSKRGALGGGIKWNFTKFLVGKDGAVIARFGPQVRPADIADAIESALKQSPAHSPS